MKDSHLHSKPVVVDFWFDAACPFAWVTSRWLREVKRVRKISIKWRVMSLAVLNEGLSLQTDYRKFIDQTWFPARAACQVFLKYGHEVLGDFYTYVGNAIHYETNSNYNGLISAALETLDLDPKIATTSDTPEYDEQLRTLHNEGVSLVGEGLGTPIISIDGKAFFGPVLTRVPRGEEAGVIFDCARTLMAYPHFFELKRSRTSRPNFSMSDIERNRDIEMTSS